MNLLKILKIDSIRAKNQQAFDNRNVKKSGNSNNILLKSNKPTIVSKSYSFKKLKSIMDKMERTDNLKIKELNSLILYLGKETNLYYYNPDAFIEDIVERLRGVSYPNEFYNMYNNELSQLLKVLVDLSEGEVKLNKNDYMTLVTYFLYLSQPAHLINIVEDLYDIDSLVYFTEATLDLSNNLLKTQNSNISFSNMLDKIMDNLESSYEEEDIQDSSEVDEFSGDFNHEENVFEDVLSESSSSQLTSGAWADFEELEEPDKNKDDEDKKLQVEENIDLDFI